MKPRVDRVVLRPGEGGSVDLGGMGVEFKIRGEQTGGLLAVVEHPIEPGRLVPPHIHEREDEYSYVLEGEVGARIGDQEVLAGPGSYLFKPRGVPHTFWNPGRTTARVLEIIVPAGFEHFFDELAGVIAAGLPPDEVELRRREIGGRYGQTLQLEWVPDLIRRYGLKPLGDQ